MKQLISFKKREYTKESEDSAIKKAQEANQIAMTAASKCLASENFQEYLEYYDKAEFKSMNALFHIDRNECDPFKYYAKMKTILTELRTIRDLKIEVENTARKAKR